MHQGLFDTQLELPSIKLAAAAKTLVGFEERYQRLKNHLRMALMPDQLESWSRRHYGQAIPLCEVIQQKHPLFLFSGDVGTGKTVTAECAANRFTVDMEKDGHLFKLSTRVRGKGLHGEKSQLSQEWCENLESQAGKRRLSFLLIDEADSIATLRSTDQMHQEEKVAVNTLIQKIDNIRQVGGRAVVFLCTNRAQVIDQAVVRRAALHIEFARPSKAQCRELIERDLQGTNLKSEEIDELASLTSPGGRFGDVGYTYSDFRLRFFPEVLARAFPDQELTFDILKEAALATKPSPQVE